MKRLMFGRGRIKTPVVTPPANPVAVLSTNIINIIATEGIPVASGNPIAITNSGGGTLTGVSISVIGGATWITPSLSGSGNNYSISYTNTVHANPAGVASTIIRVSFTNPGLSPIDINVSATTYPATSSTNIPIKLYRRDGITTNARFYMNVPLKRGMLYPADILARKVALTISGVEQSIYCEETRGGHYDGSVRSIHIQLDVAHNNNAAGVDATVVLGNVRTTNDLTRAATNEASLFSGSGSTYTLRTAGLPTSVDYLCDSRITFCSLRPRYLESSLEQAHTDRMKTMLNAIRSTELGATNNQSSYDIGIGCFGYWCKTGDVDEFFEGVRRMRWFAEYEIGSPTDTTYNPNPNIYGESIYTGISTFPNEKHSMRYYSYASAYLMTSYGVFYSVVNMISQHRDKPVRASAISSSGSTGYISQSYHFRFNLMNFRPFFAAYFIDANRKVSTPSYGNRFRVFQTEMIWAIDALEVRRMVTNDHKNGLVGQASTAVYDKLPDGSPYPGAQNGDGWNFQNGYFVSALIDLKDEVMDDPRLDDFIKTNVTKFCENIISPGSPGSYGMAYAFNGTAGSETNSSLYHAEFRGNDSYWLPFMITGTAYCKNKWPTDIVNGKTFGQWYDICIAAVNMTNVSNTWKNFGEYYAYAIQASYYANGGQPQSPPTIRASSNPTTWPS